MLKFVGHFGTISAVPNLTPPLCPIITPRRLLFLAFFHDLPLGKVSSNNHRQRKQKRCLLTFSPRSQFVISVNSEKSILPCSSMFSYTPTFPSLSVSAIFLCVFSQVSMIHPHHGRHSTGTPLLPTPTPERAAFAKLELSGLSPLAVLSTTPAPTIFHSLQGRALWAPTDGSERAGLIPYCWLHLFMARHRHAHTQTRFLLPPNGLSNALLPVQWCWLTTSLPGMLAGTVIAAAGRVFPSENLSEPPPSLTNCLAVLFPTGTSPLPLRVCRALRPPLPPAFR